MKKIIIAIDGPCASGKSTVCDIIAQKLNINHLSSGALYRALTLFLIENNFDFESIKNEKFKNKDCEICFKKLLKNVKIKVKFDNFIQKIILNGKDRTDELNSEQISIYSSIISPIKIVREFIKKIQVNLAKKGNLILDGRDITSEVLKNAKNKFYITASAEVRAKRRHLQNPTESYEKILEDIKLRDYRDTTRKLCPLKIVSDAIIIDSTNLTISETADKIIENLK